MSVTEATSERGQEFRRSGYPRPVGWTRSGFVADAGSLKAYPAPWINGEHAADGDFYSFRDDMGRAHEERLCCICGDQLGSVVAIGAYRGERATSGGWGHPRCIKLAVRMCPHFAEMEGTVAWMHVGPGVGVLNPAYEDHDDVVETAAPLDREALNFLAADDPWGTVGTSASGL